MNIAPLARIAAAPLAAPDCALERVHNMVLGMEKFGSARELTGAMRAGAKPVSGD